MCEPLGLVTLGSPLCCLLHVHTAAATSLSGDKEGPNEKSTATVGGETVCRGCLFFLPCTKADRQTGLKLYNNFSTFSKPCQLSNELTGEEEKVYHSIRYVHRSLQDYTTATDVNQGRTSLSTTPTLLTCTPLYCHCCCTVRVHSPFVFFCVSPLSSTSRLI